MRKGCGEGMMLKREDLPAASYKLELPDRLLWEINSPFS
jgi:hypothetical protein